MWQFPVLSETFILNQITGLIDRGHEVDIYALGRRPAKLSTVHPDVEKYGLLDRVVYIPRVPSSYLVRILRGAGLLLSGIHRSPSVLLRSLNVARYGKQAVSLRLLYGALLFQGRQPYDIIHCQFGPIGLEAALLRDIGALKGKLVTSFRGYDVSRYVKEHGDDVYRDLFRLGDLLLPNCEYFKRRLVALGCDEAKLVVHRSGIDCERFDFTPRHPCQSHQVRIVTIGRLVPRKGIEYCIRAVASLARANPNVELKIIGDGPLRRDLEKLIADLHMEGTVELCGEKDQREIIGTLRNSHILLAASVTAEDGGEDGPVNTLKEAMATGLPVIATQHGGIPELVDDQQSGFLVPERSSDAIAGKLRYLIDHPEAWPQMGRAGRAVVQERYSSSKLNDELVEIYRQLLSEGSMVPGAAGVS